MSGLPQTQHSPHATAPSALLTIINSDPTLLGHTCTGTEAACRANAHVHAWLYRCDCVQAQVCCFNKCTRMRTQSEINGACARKLTVWWGLHICVSLLV